MSDNAKALAKRVEESQGLPANHPEVIDACELAIVLVESQPEKTAELVVAGLVDKDSLGEVPCDTPEPENLTEEEDVLQQSNELQPPSEDEDRIIDGW